MPCLLRSLVALLPLAAAACGTPEVARDYDAANYLPEEIAGALADEDPTRRSEAAEQIGSLEPESRARTLIALTRDERPQVRLLAVGLIGRHHAGDADAADRLVDLLASDPDPDVRGASIDAITRGDRGRALDAILGALAGDASLTVRARAAEALDQLTGQTIGRAFVREAEEAEASADDAAVAYEDWLEERAPEAKP